MIQLLAHGVWDQSDESWREPLAELAAHLSPARRGRPGPVRQLAAALAAVCMGLLRNGVSLTGGTPADLLAARTWKRIKPLVADADPDLVTDLLLSPVHAHAVILNGSELEETILLAMDDDPACAAHRRAWRARLEHPTYGPMYRVSGAFTNPVTAAAQVATQLGQHLDRARPCPGR